MKVLIKIINKTIIAEYYRQNIFFIFAILMFAFGFLRAIEHETIIKLALKSPSLLSIVFIVWGLHAIKTILFSLRLLESKPYEFLYQMQLFSFPKRFLAFCWLHFSLIQLTFLYSLAMIKIGLDEKRYLEISLIILFDVFIILFGAIFTEYRIKKPNPTKVLSIPINSIFSKFRTPNYLFFIRYLFQKQPILFLLTKLFSCFILLGVCLLYPTDQYDERLLAIGGLFVATGHIVFCYENHQFETKFLTFHRNLPIPNFKRISTTFLTYFLLLIPEIIILTRNLPEKVSFIFIFQLTFYILSLIFLTHNSLYLTIKNKDVFTQKLFFIGIAFFLFIMFKIPIILIGIINFVIAFFVFQKQFYKSEYQITES